jgi:hypothetical protein
MTPWCVAPPALGPFVGEGMFFGKDQLRDIEESIIEQKGQLAKAG